jgi:hypothetical protein
MLPLSAKRNSFGTTPSERTSCSSSRRTPSVGDLIPETGGVRKIRWRRAGAGKRGGARVIYFYHDADRPLYLLMVYAKGPTGRFDCG